MSEVAPSCPVSFGQPYPGQRVFRRGDPWSRPGTLQDAINQIPRAHDMPSAIRALNIINDIVMRLNRGEPVVNNIHPPGGGGVIIKGNDNNPHYEKLDWILEGREYLPVRLLNPDDDKQYIELHILKIVSFYNGNTSHTLNYNGPGD